MAENVLPMIPKFISIAESLLTHLVAWSSKQGFNTKRYRFNFPEVWYSPWNENEAFNGLYVNIKNNTLISKRKLFDLYHIGQQLTPQVEGAILEIGAYRGGSGALFASVFTDRTLLLWDNWGKTVLEDGRFIKKTYSALDDMEQAKLLLHATKTYAGTSAAFIDEVFPNEIVISNWQQKLAVVHFDIYDAAAFTQGIELLWPRISKNGIFIVGGYGAISLDPLTKAVNSFVSRPDCLFVSLQSGIGMILKTA